MTQTLTGGSETDVGVLTSDRLYKKGRQDRLRESFRLMINLDHVVHLEGLKILLTFGVMVYTDPDVCQSGVEILGSLTVEDGDLVEFLEDLLDSELTVSVETESLLWITTVRNRTRNTGSQNR
jgi:hypothetical protein